MTREVQILVGAAVCMGAAVCTGAAVCAGRQCARERRRTCERCRAWGARGGECAEERRCGLWLCSRRSGWPVLRRGQRRTYVDPSGSDANDGLTQATAWKTVAKVNGSTFAAGDQILFKRGGVWNESLVPPSSGTSGNWTCSPGMASQGE